MIADDLSGGADTGVSFARAGLDVAIQLDAAVEPPGWAQAVVLPTDSRDRGADEASALVTDAVTALARRRPALWYKKIDSTLRGHLGVELTATIQGVRPDLTVLAPAFPAHGRTVSGGRGFLGGMPLEDTSTWQAQGMRGPADLPAMMRAAGLRVAALPLADIRSGLAAERLSAAAGAADVIVCDAESEDDLAATAAAGALTGLHLLWAGSAGLAAHLAATLGEQPGAHTGDKSRAKPCALPGPGNAWAQAPALVVVGSAAGAAGAQLRYLETRPGVRVIRVHPAAILDDRAGAGHDVASAAQAIGEAIAAGCDVAIGLVAQDAPGSRVLDPVISRVVSAALGALAGRFRDQVGGIAATGGDTALAVLAACGVSVLCPVGEVVTGVPVCLAGHDDRPVVTKAGAFGGERVLAQSLDLLHGRDAG